MFIIASPKSILMMTLLIYWPLLHFPNFSPKVVYKNVINRPFEPYRIAQTLVLDGVVCKILSAFLIWPNSIRIVVCAIMEVRVSMVNFDSPKKL